MDPDRECLGPLHDHPRTLVLLCRFGAEEKRALSTDALLRVGLFDDRVVGGYWLFHGIFDG